MKDDQALNDEQTRAAAKVAEWRDAILAIHNAALLLRLIRPELPALIDAGQRALDLGPIFQPTAWKEKHRQLEEDLEALRAALPLWRVAQKLVGPISTGDREEGAPPAPSTTASRAALHAGKRQPGDV